jgi:hypothetical protein
LFYTLRSKCERDAIIIYVTMTEINQPEKLRERWQWS